MKTTTSTGTGVAVIAAVLAISSNAIAYPEGASATPVSMRGVNLIAGAEMALRSVRIPTRAALNATDGFLIESGPETSILFKGRGRAVGIALIEDEETASERSSLIWMRTSFCGRRACKTSEMHQSWTYEGLDRNDAGTKVYLPAGDYLLYVIADGAPARVTLRLSGLAGRTHLRPRDEVDGEVRTPKVRMNAGPSRQAYWFGEDVRFGGDYGVMYSAMQVVAANWLVGERGFCVYSGESDPGPLAYSPACPSGFSFVTPSANAPPADRDIIEGWFSEMTVKGDAGFGQHVVAAADVKQVRGLFLFLDIDLSAGG